MRRHIGRFPIIIAVAVLGVAMAAFGALWVRSADAQLSTGGFSLNFSIVTGSEDWTDVLTGLGNVVSDCTAGTPGCPYVKSSVYGTNGDGNYSTTWSSCGITYESTPDNEVSVYSGPTYPCAIEGTLYCQNPAGKSSKAQGQPFQLSTTLFNQLSVNPNDCAKNGKCTVGVPVGKNVGSDACINPNWIPVSFVATEFYGLTQAVLYKVNGQQYNINYINFCYITPPSNYKPGVPYTCEPVVQ